MDFCFYSNPIAWGKISQSLKEEVFRNTYIILLSYIKIVISYLEPNIKFVFQTRW